MKVLFLSIIGILFLTSLAFADYVEEKNLTLAADGLDELEIDCGAGYLDIKGVEGLDQIEVKAEIVLEGYDDDDADEYMDRKMVLDLKKLGDKAELRSYFDDNSNWSFFGHRDRLINLTIRVPKKMALDIDDGSGYIYIDDMAASVRIEDGSGEMTVVNIKGPVTIDDGSGQIELEDITGEVEIEDGSGSIDVDNVIGQMMIDDGSGSIRLTNIEGDVDIEDGSGGMTVKNVTGSVVVDDGSGDIRIDRVTQDVRIVNAGSGGTRITNVDGRIRGDVDI